MRQDGHWNLPWQRQGSHGQGKQAANAGRHERQAQGLFWTWMQWKAIEPTSRAEPSTPPSAKAFYGQLVNKRLGRAEAMARMDSSKKAGEVPRLPREGGQM